MSRIHEDPIRSRLRRGLLAACVLLVNGAMAAAAPPAPTDVVASDRPWDGGGVARVTWVSPDVEGLEGFQVWRSWTTGETDARHAEIRKDYLAGVKRTAYQNEYDRLVDVEGMAPEDQHGGYSHPTSHSTSSDLTTSLHTSWTDSVAILTCVAAREQVLLSTPLSTTLHFPPRSGCLAVVVDRAVL